MAANLQPITSDGGLTSGGNITINNGSDIIAAINEDLNIIVQDEEDDGWALKQTITDSIGNNLSQTTLDRSSFTIDLEGGDQWQFDGNTLQVTTDSTIRGFNANVVTQALVSGGSPVASLQVVNSVNDPNIFSTFDATSTGANIKIYNGGSNGGTEYAWQFNNSGNLTVPGNTTVSTANATGGAAGKNISVVAGSADQSDFYTTSGGNVNITGGLGASNDGGGGGPGGWVNITSGASADPAGVYGNVKINTGGSNTWTFDYAGNLTLPANTFAINYANGTQVSLGGNSSSIANGNSNVSIATSNGNVTIAAVGNTTMTVTGTGANITGTLNATGNITGANLIGALANGNSNVSIASSNGNVVINAVGGARITATSTGANVTGTLTSTGKIGYASGSTVTQTTNRGNGVTINALAGTIITTSATMAAGQIDTFSVANDQVDPNNDIVLVQIVSPNFGVYNVVAQPSSTISVSLTGFYVNIVNISGFTTSSDAITIRFMVIKAPNA